VALTCVAAVPAWERINPVAAAPLPAAGATLPPTPAGWFSTAATTSWTPVFAEADRAERGDFVDSSGRQVAVFVATYALQRQKKELVAYGNSPVGANQGAIVASSRDAAARVREVIVDNGEQRALIRYYYRVGDRRTERGIVAQLWYGLSTLRGAAASSVVAMRAPCTPDCDAARALIAEFSRQ